MNPIPKASVTRRVITTLFGSLLVGAAAARTPSAAPQAVAPYQTLDNVEGAHVQLASAPIRPMAIDANAELWAVNTGDSTVERFVLNGPTIAAAPAQVIRVPWGPVSIATYENAGGDEELLVVCRSTWCLTRIERSTATVLEIIPLPAEPGDIVVVGDLAFVSCTGADEVRQLDLTNYDGVHAPGVPGFNDSSYSEATHPTLRLKSPLFLSLTADGNGVLVAPLHSGNNTTADGSSDSTNQSEQVISLDNPATSQIEGLPDEDLFLINPASGTVSVAALGVGTILFAHGINPIDGAFWQLNTNALNTLAQTEEELNGVFSNNRLTRVATPGLGVRPAPGDHRILDPGTAPFTVASTLAQPFALEFLPDGRGLVCGMGSDNVSLWTQAATLVREWDVPTGSIPRGLLAVTIDNGTVLNDYVLVYCWGTNSIEIHDFDLPNPQATGLPTLQLSFDPTPAGIRAGRQAFFTSKNSELQNLSCATCHVDAGTDFLTWNLSSGPAASAGVTHSIDHKGPMVTQTLVGLERLAPFHWRGERDELEDFKGAFEGLLGRPTELPDSDFALIKEYLFSLANPANPNQNRDRVLDGSNPFPNAMPVSPNPADWETSYLNDKEFQGRFACVECHDVPTGTNNDIFVDGGGATIPERGHFKTTAFHEVWRKAQSSVPVNVPGTGADVRAFLGAGIGHAGTPTDILDFTDNAIDPASTMDPNYMGNVLSFLHQWDQGLAPAVHASFLLNAGTPAGLATQELTNFLEPQALARNCDLVAFGTTVVLGASRTVRWFYDRSLGVFRAEDSTLANRTMAQFIAAAQAAGSQESTTFVGLPVGMGERFAIDFDFDGLLNGQDLAPSVQWGPGSGQPDPNPGVPTRVAIHAPKWLTTKAGRFTFETSEPTVARVRYIDLSTVGSAPLQVKNSPYWSRTHSFALADLRPSTPNMAGLTAEFSQETVTYAITFDFLDLAGNFVDGLTLAPPFTQFSTDPFIVASNLNPIGTGFDNEADRISLEEHVIADVPRVQLLNVGGGQIQATVTLSTAYKLGGSAAVPADRRLFVLRAWRRLPSGELDQLASNGDVIFSGSSLGAQTVRVENLGPPPAGFRSLDVSGPLILATDLTGTTAPGQTSAVFTLANGWLSPQQELVVSVEAVIEVPAAQFTQYQTRIANHCPLGNCSFDVPVNALRAMTQWDMPGGTEDRIRGSSR